METVKVALGARSYDILIEEGLLDRAGARLAALAHGRRLFVISDDQVWAAQGRRLTAALERIKFVPILVAPGETSKSWSGLERVVEQLLSGGIERDDVILLFGGGVVGDLGGLAAALVNRGCRFVHIPTSLLAQVDSSTGGKTAINAAAGKNLIGAFHQPSLVLIDPTCLQTLPDRHVRAGYAEIVKYALAADASFFEWLERHVEEVLLVGSAASQQAISVAVAGKARIVEEDELETEGRRALLNFGHTFAHALEAELDYELLHGEAVAVGLALAFDLSCQRGSCSPQDADRVRRHLMRVRLPTSLAALGLHGQAARLVGHMLRDKKRRGGRLRFILSRGIGTAFVDSGVEPGEVNDFLNRAGR